jgi:hypothetical protein
MTTGPNGLLINEQRNSVCHLIDDNLRCCGRSGLSPEIGGESSGGNGDKLRPTVESCPQLSDGQFSRACCPNHFWGFAMNAGACLQAILRATDPRNRLQAGSYNGPKPRIRFEQQSLYRPPSRRPPETNSGHKDQNSVATTRLTSSRSMGWPSSVWSEVTVPSAAPMPQGTMP